MKFRVYRGRQRCALLSLLLCFLECAFLFTGSAFPMAAAEETPPSTGAAASVLMEAESGRFLFAQNASLRLPMASTTKIMTALVVLRLCALSDTVTVTEEAAGTEGSSMYLESGEQYTVESLLYGLMLESANDAAVALAIHAAGSPERFAALMNAEAERMGLKNTHFVTVNGLDDENHYTTAEELAIIAGEALEDPTFAAIVSCKRQVVVSTGGRRCFLTNHNRLLREYRDCIGVKTGYTIRSGRCLVSAAKRDGMTLIAVTLHDRQDWKDHRALLDYGFAAWRKVTFAEAGALSYDTPLGRLTNREAFTALLPVSADLSHVTLTVKIYEKEKDGVCGSAVFQAGDAAYTAVLCREASAEEPSARAGEKRPFGND